MKLSLKGQHIFPLFNKMRPQWITYRLESQSVQISRVVRSKKGPKQVLSWKSTQDSSTGKIANNTLTGDGKKCIWKTKCKRNHPFKKRTVMRSSCMQTGRRRLKRNRTHSRKRKMGSNCRKTCTWAKHKMDLHLRNQKERKMLLWWKRRGHVWVQSKVQCLILPNTLNCKMIGGLNISPKTYFSNHNSRKWSSVLN